MLFSYCVVIWLYICENVPRSLDSMNVDANFVLNNSDNITRVGPSSENWQWLDFIVMFLSGKKNITKWLAQVGQFCVNVR